MSKAFVLTALVLLLACTKHKTPLISVNKIECEFDLCPDSTINFEITYSNLGSDTICCYEFKNNSTKEYYFIVDSFSNKITSTNRYAFFEEEQLIDFRCSFGPSRRIYIPPKSMARGYIFDSKDLHRFDSSFVEFLFYDKNDSVLEVKYKTSPLDHMQ